MTPAFRHEIRRAVLWVLTICLLTFPIRDYHPVACCFPADFLYVNEAGHEPKPHIPASFQSRFGLSSSLFSRPYWGNRYFFLFLRILRCFNSPRSPSQAGFHLPASKRMSYSAISGSKAACASPKHIAACRDLHRCSSQAILLTAWELAIFVLVLSSDCFIRI